MIIDGTDKPQNSQDIGVPAGEDAALVANKEKINMVESSQIKSKP
jgi:hypothetical protein